MGKNRGKRTAAASSDETESYCPYEVHCQAFYGSRETLADYLFYSLDKAQEKNPQTKMSGYQALVCNLRAKDAPEFMARNRDTLLDLCNRLSSKGGKECYLSILLVGLVTVQAGEAVTESILEPLFHIRRILMDETRCVFLRNACALVLGVASRIVCSDAEQITANAKACRFAWLTTNYTKNEHHAKLLATALSSWCTILLDAETKVVDEAVQDQPKLVKLLQSRNLEVRLAAAETLGFLYELMRGKRPDFRFENTDQVLEDMKGLEQEHSKSVSRRDRRTQRAAVRDIRAYIAEEADAPKSPVKSGFQTLDLGSFSEKIFYDLVCELLHGGISQHLVTNELLREVFGLGPCPLVQFETKRSGTMHAGKSVFIACHNDYVKHRCRQRGRDRDSKMMQFYEDYY